MSLTDTCTLYIFDDESIYKVICTCTFMTTYIYIYIYMHTHVTMNIISCIVTALSSSEQPNVIHLS